MNIKDYIIEKINDLVVIFPFLKVSYQIDNYSKSNYIKVLPKESFNNDEDYQKHETNLIIDFITNYPEEEIVFVSEDCLIEVTEPIYETEGKSFNQNTFTINSDIWSNNFDIDFKLTLNSSVNDTVENYNSLTDIVKSFDSKAIKEISEQPTIIEQEEGYSFAFAA